MLTPYHKSNQLALLLTVFCRSSSVLPCSEDGGTILLLPLPSHAEQAYTFHQPQSSG